MNNNKLDRDEIFDMEIKKILDINKQDMAEDAVWQALERRIDFDSKTVRDAEYQEDASQEGDTGHQKLPVKRKSHIGRILRPVIGIAAACMLIFVIGTTPGRAMLDSVMKFFGGSTTQDYYSSEKGGGVKVDATLYESSLGYVTFYDKTYFDITKTDTSDKFTPKASRGVKAAESYLEVRLIKDKKPEDVAKELVEKYKKIYEEVDVAREGDYSNGSSYMFSPLDGISIEAHPHIDKMAVGEKAVKDAYWESCKVASFDGNGTILIINKYNPTDDATTFRLSGTYRDMNFISKATMKNIEEGKKVMVFDYDKSMYQLAKLRGEFYMYLSPKTAKTEIEMTNTWVMAYAHFYNKDKEKIADEVMHYSDMKKVKSDLKLNSIKLVGGEFTQYLIDDGQGGVYDIQLRNLTDEEMKEFTDSIRLVPQTGDEEQMKPDIEVNKNSAG